MAGVVQTLNKLDVRGLKKNADGVAQLAMFEKNGLLTKDRTERFFATFQDRGIKRMCS